MSVGCCRLSAHRRPADKVALGDQSLLAQLGLIMELAPDAILEGEPHAMSPPFPMPRIMDHDATISSVLIPTLPVAEG